MNPSTPSGCKHENTWFSRTIELCSHGIEGMHNFCSDCGVCMDNHAPKLSGSGMEQISFNERECEHCKGSICIRMPVPSSKCDHLYYPDCCPTCKEREEDRNPSLEALLRKENAKLLREREEVKDALEELITIMTPGLYTASDGWHRDKKEAMRKAKDALARVKGEGE